MPPIAPPLRPELDDDGDDDDPDDVLLPGVCAPPGAAVAWVLPEVATEPLEPRVMLGMTWVFDVETRVVEERELEEEDECEEEEEEGVDCELTEGATEPEAPRVYEGLTVET